jgi:hypothetical protein
MISAGVIGDLALSPPLGDGGFALRRRRSGPVVHNAVFGR